MTKVLFFSILISCFLFSHCSESPENKPSSNAGTTTSDSNIPELQSVCDCFEYAMGTLNDALLLRKKYDSMQDYQKDIDAVKQMKVFMNRWHDVQKHCLMKYGSKMFMDTDCNRPQELTDKREALKALGITT